MEALYSVPILSIFLVPVLSSYSTSLNLLFFYMTWTTLVLSHSRLRVELFGTIAIRFIFFVLPSVTFFLFDILTPSAALHFKAQGPVGLPGGRRRRKIRAKELKVAGWALFNLCLGIAAQGFLESTLVTVLGKRSVLRVSLKLPMPFEICLGLTKALLGREIMAYGFHRWVLHSDEHYYLSKWHRSWHHGLPAPFPLTAHYDHPVSYLFFKFIPTYAPAVVCRFHMITYLLYLLLVSIEETFAYSGYTVMPTKFFLGGIARRMDMHLMMRPTGNYGPWGILDWLFGTTVSDSKYEDYSSDEAPRTGYERTGHEKKAKYSGHGSAAKTKRR